MRCSSTSSARATSASIRAPASRRAGASATSSAASDGAKLRIFYVQGSQLMCAYGGSAPTQPSFSPDRLRGAARLPHRGCVPSTSEPLGSGPDRLRAAAVVDRSHGRAGALLPAARRARRQRARAARRPDGRAARDGADLRADRERAARSRARATRAAMCRSRRPTTRSPSWRARWRGCCRRSTRRATETEATLVRQREFVADASHELRTPLTSVLANLELLAEQVQGEQREAVESALRSSRRMRRLVADLLLLARADAGREQPHHPTDLARVLVGVAAELEPVDGRPRAVDRRGDAGDRLRRARRAAPSRAQPRRERTAPHAARHAGARRGDARERRRRPDSRG